MRELIRFSNEINEMKRRIDKIMDEFLGREKNTIDEPSANFFVPPVKIVEGENEVKIYILIPFTEKENINVDIKENVLRIEGKSLFNISDKEEVIRDEIPVGNFSRSFKIGYEIDTSKIKASYKNSILEIILPKKEEAKASKINIE
jgi:HSP20 family protein